MCGFLIALRFFKHLGNVESKTKQKKNIFFSDKFKMIFFLKLHQMQSCNNIFNLMSKTLIMTFG